LVWVTARVGTPQPDRVRLAQRLDAILGDGQLASASAGVLVVRTASGEVVYEREPDRALMPASNMKIVTSLAALQYLGPAFRFTTTLCAEAAPNAQGWIVGDLYVRGSGDPTVTHEDLDTLAARLAALGVTRITGEVVADGSCFADPPLGRGWPASDETYAYSAQICGLSVDGNVVHAEATGGPEAGAPCALQLSPPSSHLTLDPGCRTGGPDAGRPALLRRRAQNVLYTTGPVPAGGRVSATVSMEAPDLYAAELLQQCLVERGLRVDGACRRGVTPPSAVPMAWHRSPPLRDLLAMMNVPSDNNMAESLLRALPLARGEPGTGDEGTRILEEYLEEVGVPTSPLRLSDGSGLSRLNLLTPRALVGLLVHAARSADLREPFVASLPVAGVDGTLRSRMLGTAAAGRMRAKTGSLLGVCTLSGYVAGRDECELAVSLMMNNYTCAAAQVRELQDRACAALAEYTAP